MTDKNTDGLTAITKRIDEIKANKAAVRERYEKDIADAREVIAHLDAGVDSLLDPDTAITAEKEKNDAEAKIAFCERQIEKLGTDPCITEEEYTQLEKVFNEYRLNARDEWREDIHEPMQQLAAAFDRYRSKMDEADQLAAKLDSVTNAGKTIKPKPGQPRRWARPHPINGKAYYGTGVNLAVMGPERDYRDRIQVTPEFLGAWRAVKVMRDPSPTIYTGE